MNDEQNKQPLEEQQQTKEKQEMGFMLMGMNIGLCFGVCFGIIFDHLALGIPIGLALGLSIGSLLDHQKKGKDQ